MSARTFELTQYLVDELGWRPPEPATRREVAYHDSCHMLRELRLHDQPRALLAAVADLHELPRADRCCGFGGTFSIRYPDVSTAMADDKLASAATISAAHASRAPTRDASCRSRAGRRAWTPASGSSTSPPSWQRPCERLRGARRRRAGRSAQARERAPVRGACGRQPGPRARGRRHRGPPGRGRGGPLPGDRRPAGAARLAPGEARGGRGRRPPGAHRRRRRAAT